MREYSIVAHLIQPVPIIKIYLRTHETECIEKYQFQLFKKKENSERIFNRGSSCSACIYYKKIYLQTHETECIEKYQFQLFKKKRTVKQYSIVAHLIQPVSIIKIYLQTHETECIEKYQFQLFKKKEYSERIFNRGSSCSACIYH